MAEIAEFQTATVTATAVSEPAVEQQTVQAQPMIVQTGNTQGQV